MIKSIFFTGKNRRPSQTLNRTSTPENNNRALRDFSCQVETTWQQYFFVIIFEKPCWRKDNKGCMYVCMYHDTKSIKVPRSPQHFPSPHWGDYSVQNMIKENNKHSQLKQTHWKSVSSQERYHCCIHIVNIQQSHMLAARHPQTNYSRRNLGVHVHITVAPKLLKPVSSL